MAYPPDMRAAARRHFEAADKLDVTSRRDVAGYLYGIAAECGIKAMMEDAGFKILAERGRDPFFAHFPELRTMLRDKVEGRNATALRRFIINDNFFSEWAIQMRYCKGKEIKDKLIDRWKMQAKDVVGSIGT